METVEKLMRMVKREYLSEIAENYGVNRCNNKLTGELIFKGLMKLILMGKKISLRMLEMLINQGVSGFQGVVKVSYSGIAKRLKIIKWKYFEHIYVDLINKFSNELSKKDRIKLHRFDSTIINLSV